MQFCNEGAGLSNAQGVASCQRLAILQVFPEQLDIRANSSATFRVAFRPVLDGQYYTQSLDVIVCLKSQRSFRGIAEGETVLPPWTFPVQVSTWRDAGSTAQALPDWQDYYSQDWVVASALLLDWLMHTCLCPEAKSGPRQATDVPHPVSEHRTADNSRHLLQFTFIIQAKGSQLLPPWFFHFQGGAIQAYLAHRAQWYFFAQ